MKRRLAIGALALLLPVAVFAALLFNGTSTGPFTPLLESQLSRLLGRELHFGTPPYLELGSRVRIVISDVALADAAPGAPPMLELAAGEVELEARSLLRGPVEFHELSLSRLKLSLHIDESGNSNLPPLLQGNESIDDDDDSDAVIPIRIASALIEDAQLRFTDARDGRDATLLLERVTQENATSRAMSLQGHGELQGRPWNIDLTLSSPQPLRERGPFSADLRGELSQLTVTGTASAPSAKTLADLELALHAEGTLPEEITRLSPLLEPDTPVYLDLQVADTQPGIDLDLDLRLPRASLQAKGHIGTPAQFDGVELNITARADNADRILAAFHLPTLSGDALKASGTVSRHGNRLEITALEAALGEHQLRGEVLVPSFPDPEDARADIAVSGPDFSIYPRLAGAAPLIARPYEASFILIQRDGPELVDADLRIGQHEITVDGPIGGLPVLAGSRLALRFRGPELTPFAQALALDLPDSDYAGNMDVAVADDGRLIIHRADVAAFAAQFSATGSWDGAPDFASGQLRIDAATRSLAESAERLRLRRLGDLPVEVTAAVRRSAATLTIDELAVQSPALGITQRAGNVIIDSSGARSDLELEVSLTDLRQLLGDYAAGWSPIKPLVFTLGAGLKDDRLRFAFEGMRSGGVTGSAHVAIGTDFTFDASTEVAADLRIENPARLLPTFPNIGIGEHPLHVIAETEWSGTQPTVDYRISGPGDLVLGGSFTPAAEDNAEAVLIIRGQAADMHEVVTSPLSPPGPMPLTVDGQVRLSPAAVAADIRELSLAGSTLRGDVIASKDGRSIRATLDIPQGRLQPWIDHYRAINEPEEGVAEKSKKPSADRLIPDIPLPLDALKERELFLSLSTGPLGIADPFRPTESLIDRSTVEIELADERLHVAIGELIGSRGTTSGDLHLDAAQPEPEVSLSMAIRGMHLALISRAPTIDAAPKQDIDLNLSSRGRSFRELAANLDGELLLVGGKGILEDTSLSFVTDSFIQQLVLTLMPMLDQRTDVEVVCAVVGARARSGVVSLDPGFIYRTKRVDLSARGEINLATERLRIRFDNQARKGLGISAASLVNPYVQITGTLARPTLGLDVANSAVAGGAAVATGGLTVIAKPLLGRIFQRKNPCEVAVAEWRKSQESP